MLIFLYIFLSKNKTLKKIDDAPMIQCEECHIWQHILCLAATQGIPPEDIQIEAWKASHFVCDRCKEEGFMDAEMKENDDEFILDKKESSESSESEYDEQQGLDLPEHTIKLVIRAYPPMIQMGTLQEYQEKMKLLKELQLEPKNNVLERKTDHPEQSKSPNKELGGIREPRESVEVMLADTVSQTTQELLMTDEHTLSSVEML
jgi:hypothetical protein